MPTATKVDATPKIAPTTPLSQPDSRQETGLREVLILGTLTVLALLLRLLGRGLESIWLDESVSLEVARYAPLDLLTGRQFEPGNPAGYFLLLRGWMGLWGDASIETARALSACAGAACVPAVWLLAWAVGAPRRTTWLACLLVAISPPLVYLSQEARVFSLFATVATLAVVAVARIEKTDKWGAWAAFVACAALLVHLHYFAFFVLVALGLELLFWSWTRSSKAVAKLVAASGLIALAFAPYLPVFLRQLALGASRSADTWWQHLVLLPYSSVAGRTLVWKDGGQGGKALVGLVGLLVLLTVFLPLLGLVIKGRVKFPRSVLALAFGVPVLVGLLALAGVPMIHTHYLSVVFPAVMLLVAWALDVGLAARSRWVWLPVAVLLALMPVALARVYTKQHKTDWRGVAAHIAAEGGDKPVFFYEDIGGIPFTYYRPEQPATRIIKPFGKEGEGWGKEGVVEQMQQERNGFWLVIYPTNQTTLGEEKEIVSWLHRGWDVTETSFAPMRVLWCVPRTFGPK